MFKAKLMIRETKKYLGILRKIENQLLILQIEARKCLHEQLNRDKGKLSLHFLAMLQ